MTRDDAERTFQNVLMKKENGKGWRSRVVNYLTVLYKDFCPVITTTSTDDHFKQRECH